MMPATRNSPDGGVIQNYSPPTSFAAVTKSDSTDLTGTRALWVGTAGDVAVMGVGDSVAVTLKNVPSGTLIPGLVKRVMSANTTASDIVALS